MTATPPFARLTFMSTLVFLTGLLMQLYGLHFALFDGAFLAALAWVVGGLLLQVASGARSRSRGTSRFVNPFVALRDGLRAVRQRVRGWE
jgi:hypothetical protein